MSAVPRGPSLRPSGSLGTAHHAHLLVVPAGLAVRLVAIAVPARPDRGCSLAGPGFVSSSTVVVVGTGVGTSVGGVVGAGSGTVGVVGVSVGVSGGGEAGRCRRGRRSRSRTRRLVGAGSAAGAARALPEPTTAGVSCARGPCRHRDSDDGHRSERQRRSRADDDERLAGRACWTCGAGAGARERRDHDRGRRGACAGGVSGLHR